MTITIEGPQGVGKTTLAMLLATLLRAEWPEDGFPDRCASWVFPMTVDGEDPPVENVRAFHANMKMLTRRLVSGNLSIDIVTRQTP